MNTENLVLKYKLNDKERAKFFAYIKNRFLEPNKYKNENTNYINVWKTLAVISNIIGTTEMINRKLCPRLPINFNKPDGVRFEIFNSFAGEIPIIYANDEKDFESLVINIIHKGNRPANIEQTGAAFVSGKTTRFIILSAKPYSNVKAIELGLNESDWAEKSMIVRRSHECTHYFTKQTFGVSNNILHDELIADFIGLYDAFGLYKADWFLRFMGIISGSGGRLSVYTNGLPIKVKQAIIELITQAANSLEKWSQSADFAKLTNRERITIMCRIGIDGITNL